MKRHLIILILFTFCFNTMIASIEEAKESLNKKDFKTALKLFNAEAYKDNAEAYFYISQIYDLGLGIKPNKKIAIEHLKKSADLKFSLAEFILASKYLTGKGILQNYKKAKDLLIRADKQNFSLASFLLGSLYLTEILGSGDAANQKGIAYIKKAADLNFPLAIIELAKLYEKGEKAQKNYKKAFEWYNKAMVYKLPFSYYKVGVFYNEGYGVKVDKIKAHIYLNIASKKGIIEAQNSLQVLSKELTLEQLKEAQERAIKIKQ